MKTDRMRKRACRALGITPYLGFAAIIDRHVKSLVISPNEIRRMLGLPPIEEKE